MLTKSNKAISSSTTASIHVIESAQDVAGGEWVVKQPSILFGCLGLAIGLVAAGAIDDAFGPNGHYQSIAIVAGAPVLVALPLVAASIGFVLARYCFERSADVAVGKGKSFLIGSLIALSSAAACAITHTLLSLFWIDAETAFWMGLAELMVGCLAFGWPLVVGGGLLGIFATRQRRNVTSNPAQLRL